MNNSEKQALDAWEIRFHQFFRPADREIELLDAEIDQKKGFFLFKWHKYTQNELENSKHHSKIDSITTKIGSDLSNWYKRGELPEFANDIYRKYKHNLEEELHQVNIKIKKHKPTWLEDAWDALEAFADKIINKNLHPLVRNFLDSMRNKITKLFFRWGDRRSASTLK